MTQKWRKWRKKWIEYQAEKMEKWRKIMDKMKKSRKSRKTEKNRLKLAIFEWRKKVEKIYYKRGENYIYDMGAYEIQTNNVLG